MRGNSKIAPCAGSLRPMQCLLFFALLLQSCAITTTESRVVPGPELSRTSLGFREVENKIVVKELNPYSVAITRHICEADFVIVEHLGMIQLVQKRQELYCADAYPEYAMFQVTALGVPFFYDMVTGFGIFRKMCDKGPPQFVNATQESDIRVMQEEYDSKTRICRDVPVPAALVAVKIDDYMLTLVSSASGTVALTPEQVAAVESSGRNVSLDYQYENEIITTTIKQAAKPESQLMAKMDVDNAAVKNSGGRSAEEPDDSELKRNRLSREINSLGNNAEDNISKADRPESQMMAKLDEEYAAVKSKKDPGASAVNAEQKMNKISRNVNKIAAAVKQTSKDESQMMAKLDDQNAAVKNNRNLSDVKSENQNLQSKQLSSGLDSSGKSVEPKSAAKSSDVELESRYKVEFETNKAVIKESYLDNLKLVAEEMKKKPKMISVIEGHTDNVGSAEINRKISLRRASAIKKVLVKKHGVDAEHIQVKGYGFAKPIAGNDTADGRAKNRRTEIRIGGATEVE